MAGVRLSELSQGEIGKIVRIEAGRCLRQRLMSMGLVTGSEIKVIRKNMPGPFIISIKSCCRIAIGCGEACKIIVEKSE